jgi:hypothetical protein
MLRDGLAGRERGLSAARRGEIEMVRLVGKFIVGQSRDIPFSALGAGPSSCDPGQPPALHRLEKNGRSAGLKRSSPTSYVRPKMSPPRRKHSLWQPSSGTSVARVRAHRQWRSLFHLGA